MALFKSLRGKRENLPSTKTDGYAYFCIDDGTFWIDYKDENGTVQRKQLNAKEAELLAGASLSTVLNSSDVEIPTSKAVKNSPAFTGTPTAPTAVAGTNTTQIATTEFVSSAISDLAAKSYVDETVSTHNTATNSHSDIREKIQSVDESIMLKKQTITPQFPSSRNWNEVVYGNGVFVATTLTNKAAYSKDGINWTEVDLPVLGYWYGITYGKDRFVMVNNNNFNSCLYSNDGITWTKSTLPQNAYWKSVAYGNNRFVAIATGSGSYGQSNVAAYSSDGITWTAITLPITANWCRITYGNGKFVALAAFSTKAVYSTDGITWTEMTLPVSGYWDCFVYGGDKFVAVHSVNSNSVIYSTDGVTWSQSTLPAVKAHQSISYGNGMYVVTTSNWSEVYYSTDAINWTTVMLNTYGYGSCYGGNKFIVTPTSGTEISYSYDGITWHDSYSIDKVQLSDLSTEIQEKLTNEAYTEDEITTLYNAV